jgi:hypothetical protein
MNKLNLLVTFTNKNRRREERRRYSSRIIKHAFGSDKWVQVVRSSYMFWPKEGRRTQQRRSLMRRTKKTFTKVSFSDSSTTAAEKS